MRVRYWNKEGKMEVSPKRFSELAVHTDHVARVSKTIQAAYK